jgi:hypothetical protein
MSFLNKIAVRQPVNIQAQIAQIKSAGQATVSPNTQGVPKVVADVTVRKKNLSATQAQLTVSFMENPNDLYFVRAQIYLKLGNANPVLIGQGASSPLNVNVTRTSVPATIIVVSAGNWGSTDVNFSPVQSLSLQ